MNKTVLMAILLFVTICSSAAVGAGENIVKAADIQPTPTAAGQEEDNQLVIDITSGLLQINARVLQNLARFLPASETATIVSVRKHFGQLLDKLATEPDAVLAATQDDQLESLLKQYGPGDPFSSLPFLSSRRAKAG